MGSHLAQGAVCLSLSLGLLAAQEPAWEQRLQYAADLQRSHQYTEAEAVLNGIVNAAERSNTSDLRVAIALNRLGSIYHEQGRLLDAERVYQRSIPILERALGPESPDLGHTLNNLGETCSEIGQYSKAERVFARALGISRAQSSTNGVNATLLQNLAATYIHEGRNGDAEPLLTEALAIQRNATPPDEIGTAAVLNSLAAVAYATGDRNKAVGYAKEALAIMGANVEDYPAQFAQVLSNLGVLFFKTGDDQGAESCLKRAAAAIRNAFGPEHPLYGTILKDYASVLRRLHRSAEAKQMEKQAKAIQAKYVRENALGYTVDARARGTAGLR